MQNISSALIIRERFFYSLFKYKLNKFVKFRALEIGSGDAFLIENEGKQILFDSGGSESRIIDLISPNKIIDLAICSHNDSDHANGFIGLLKSPSHEIKEIWLPGMWVPILNFIIENEINGKLTEIIFRDKRGINDIRDYNSLVEESNVSIEIFDEGLQRISEIEEYVILPHFYLFTSFYWFNSPIINLGRILKIAGLAYKKGSLIRWFKPESINPTIQNPNYGFKPLNSKEVVKIDRVAESNVLSLMFLTMENKFSLVFEFYNDDKPIITFSADSDFSFLENKTYNNNIIVTAPHHGSENNSIVYRKIKGDNIIWIRSDRKNKNRPCLDFKNLPNKYCLSCAVKNYKKEIFFEYDFMKNRWNWKSGIKCDCK